MKANIPNETGNGGDESSVNGEGHNLNILDGDLQTVNIPEQKTFLDDQFVDCVYKLERCLIGLKTILK